MKYTIYKITNLLNQKIYIGKHQTKNLNDGYFGSGIVLRKAIAKYGKENFIKEILFIFDKEEEMNSKEVELITEDFVKLKNTYNLGIGGEGGPHFRGRKHTEQSKQKIGRRGRILSEDARKKISESNRRRTLSQETKTKLSLAKYLANGKTLQEAQLLSKNRHNIVYTKKSKSDILKEYYKNPENRHKKAEQMRKLHEIYDLTSIKIDYDSGLKPKEIMKKYELTKNRYHHIRSYYLKEK